ncbi:MerR family transcriptional regulator [Geoalkalibacter subterraneus]|jgi:DNA-binding transcriptional MerR regulator|uniref:MerR family transcriptional regulator n=1 Tax=Geoalkalibacter subterraneus TaxID=483547 RepID=A0A0B5FGM8_9BACT|nr:MerR family transcriptional regulator [Geoalkalibacter subterraneus]AJF06463.1 MerR family transcriptional regulator [Geoalkalibacter subterraneus]
MDIEIPDKLYFKIGEVSRITGVKPHVLRYWESEFGAFSPNKSRSRQRLYQRKDIELILRLKRLLYQEGYTISGARRKLREKDAAVNAEPRTIAEPDNVPGSEKVAGDEPHDLLSEVRKDLRNLRELLRRDPPRRG